jgi:hypothetical protein
MDRMRRIDFMNIDDVDLNLLRAFDAGLRERSGTAAAARSGRDILLVGPCARLMFHLFRIGRKLVRGMTFSDAKKKVFI